MAYWQLGAFPTTMRWTCLRRLRLFRTVSTLVKLRGSAALERIFPPVVVGPVIIIIGMGLAPVAVDSGIR